MRFILLLFVFVSSVFAMEFYSKLEPINSYSIKSAVSGKVDYTNKDIEGTKLQKNQVVVKLDSSVEQKDYSESKNKLKSLDEIINIQEKNYQRISNISSKSAFDKDNQKIQVLNLELQKSDLVIKLANLKYTLENKTLKEKKDSYIYNIAVQKGDYVNPGTLLYDVKDMSKGKLEIFIPISDYENILNKAIYIDGEKTDLKVNKLYKVADSKHISSYKCEIHLPNPKVFSRLVKIEFK